MQIQLRSIGAICLVKLLALSTAFPSRDLRDFTLSPIREVEENFASGASTPIAGVEHPGSRAFQESPDEVHRTKGSILSRLANMSPAMCCIAKTDAIVGLEDTRKVPLGEAIDASDPPSLASLSRSKSRRVDLGESSHSSLASSSDGFNQWASLEYLRDCQEAFREHAMLTSEANREFTRTGERKIKALRTMLELLKNSEWLASSYGDVEGTMKTGSGTEETSRSETYLDQLNNLKKCQAGLERIQVKVLNEIPRLKSLNLDMELRENHLAFQRLKMAILWIEKSFKADGEPELKIKVDKKTRDVKLDCILHLQSEIDAIKEELKTVRKPVNNVQHK